MKQCNDYIQVSQLVSVCTCVSTPAVSYSCHVVVCTQRHLGNISLQKKLKLRTTSLIKMI